MKHAIFSKNYIPNLDLYQVNASAGTYAGAGIPRNKGAFAGVLELHVISGAGGATTGTVKLEKQLADDSWVDAKVVTEYGAEAVATAFDVAAGEKAVLKVDIAQYNTDAVNFRVSVTTTAGELDAVLIGIIKDVNLLENTDRNEAVIAG